MKFRLMPALLVVLAFCSHVGAADSDDAMSAALSWLKLVDRGDYAASSRESAKLFQKKVTVEKWAAMLAEGRAPLGKLVSRAEKSRKHVTYMNGAPDGEYYVIQFNSSFEKKEDAHEVVTTTLESDGQWRVAGYFIQ